MVFKTSAQEVGFCDLLQHSRYPRNQKSKALSSSRKCLPHLGPKGSWPWKKATQCGLGWIYFELSNIMNVACQTREVDRHSQNYPPGTFLRTPWTYGCCDITLVWLYFLKVHRLEPPTPGQAHSAPMRLDDAGLLQFALSVSGQSVRTSWWVCSHHLTEGSAECTGQNASHLSPGTFPSSTATVSATHAQTWRVAQQKSWTPYLMCRRSRIHWKRPGFGWSHIGQGAPSWPACHQRPPQSAASVGLISLVSLNFATPPFSNASIFVHMGEWSEILEEEHKLFTPLNPVSESYPKNHQNLS